MQTSIRFLRKWFALIALLFLLAGAAACFDPMDAPYGPPPPPEAP